MKKILSIIIPCFNEEKTIEKILIKILKQRRINKQIILVNIFLLGYYVLNLENKSLI